MICSGLFGTKPAFNTNEADFASASGLNTTDNTAAHISSDGPYYHGPLCPFHRRREIQMIKDQGVYIAHCPESNTDIASGIAPIRRYLDMGLHVGLGTDVAGGFSLSMFRAIADAIQVSKLRWRLMDQTQAPVTLEEAFYMATIGGGSFFGKVGTFEKGYEFDAMILDDSNIRHPQEISTRDRLERLVYLSDDRNLVGKYVQGRKVI